MAARRLAARVFALALVAGTLVGTGCGGSGGGSSPAGQTPLGVLYVKNGFSNTSSIRFATLRFAGIADRRVAPPQVPDVVPEGVLSSSGQNSAGVLVLDNRAGRDDLYVVSGTDILHFDSASTIDGQRVAARTFGGFTQPTGLFIDTAGRLYVSDFGTDVVLVFAAVDSLTTADVVASANPLAIAVTSPTGVVYDEVGDSLYVCQATDPGAILAFDQFVATSPSTPTRTLTNSNLREPRSASVDRGSNRIYIGVPTSGAQFARVLAFALDAPSGAAAPILRLFTVSTPPTLDGFIDLVHDGGRDRLYVACEASNSIFVYDGVSGLSGDQDVPPDGTIETPNASVIEAPAGLAIDLTR